MSGKEHLIAKQSDALGLADIIKEASEHLIHENNWRTFNALYIDLLFLQYLIFLPEPQYGSRDQEHQVSH
ncbi:MAG TPA: hypothetical protein ACQGQH_05230 [Xylella sp.]